MEEKAAFISSRLRLARRRRRLTLRDLAKQVEVTAAAVSNYESGTRIPPLEVQQRLAAALRVDVNFFHKEDRDEVALEHLSFRAVSALPLTLKESARAAGQIAVEFAALLEQHFELPEFDLPDLSGIEPELAAELVRAHCGIDPGPVDDVIEVLEAHGVRIFSLAEDTKRVDAFMFWKDATPFVLLNTRKSPERSRFDAAHELAHVCLHRNQPPQGRVAEKEADRFASAFLMDESMLEDLPFAPTLDDMLRAKLKWKVSAPAFVKRLHTLGRLSDWEYRDLFIRISAAGGRTTELRPRMEQRERSQLLTMAFKHFAQKKITRASIAAQLAVRTDDIEGMLVHLAPAAVEAVDEAPAEDDIPEDETPDEIPSIERNERPRLSLVT